MRPYMNVRKSLSSLLKRYFILTSGGYSVGKAYGARFLFDWRHALDKKVALELYEREQISYLLDVLKQIKPNLYVDIGSHAALYSIVMKVHLPSLEVHAFEPDRTNLCQLYANLFVNKLQYDIKVHEFGLSDHSGKVMFATSEDTSSRGTRRISSTGNDEIEVRCLDDVLNAQGRIVAVKIDVEGHECQVVEGAKRFLAGNQCFMQIESSAQNLERLSKQLNSLSYRQVKMLHSDYFFTNIRLDL